jgi:hypothetical protein
MVKALCLRLYPMKDSFYLWTDERLPTRVKQTIVGQKQRPRLKANIEKLDISKL